MNNYYNEKAKEFIANVHHLDMSHLYNVFEKYIPHPSRILDVGSGTGRDSLYFTKKGHTVTSFDASESLVEFSRMFLDDVRLDTFQSFQSEEAYHGIWACASLLHVERKDILMIIQKYIDMLVEGGVFYMSFKRCDYDYIKDGIQYTCFSSETLHDLLNHTHDAKIVELFETEDVRPHRVETWVNVIIQKI